MEIRLITPDDAKEYWELRLEALQKNSESFATSYEEAIQRTNPIEQVENNLRTEGNYTFGAFSQNKLVGMVTLSQEGYLKMKHRANIFAMYVTPQARGVGAGRGLLLAAINKAREIEGIEKVNLSVVSTNEKAKNLYTKLGFKVFGIEERALKVANMYLDEDHMTLIL